MKSTSKRLRLFLLGLGICASPTFAQSPGAFAAAGKMVTPRALHTSTLLPDGKVLLAGGDSAYYFSRTEPSAELYDAASGIFAPTGTMTTPRSGHTSTLLANGKVLIAGGGPTLIGTGPFSLASAELYDPATRTFAATGSMTVERSEHNATLLKNGKVLITGGYRLDQSYSISYPDTAELYDPATGTFAPVGISGASCDTATLLLDGRVLITRRDPDQDRVSHAALYDPSIGAFVPTADMNTGHTKPSATLLLGGKVLIAGGDIGDLDGASSSAELYDPATGKFTATGSLITGRERNAATLLFDGRVLFAGGYAIVPVPGGYDNLASAEIYDPSTGAFSDAGAMLTGRDLLAATLLKDGRVLITGGNEYYLPWAAGPRDFVLPEAPVAELFTPSLIPSAPAPANSPPPTHGTFTAAGVMTKARAGHSATLLLDGRVLIVGGEMQCRDCGLEYDQATGTAELYDAATGTFTPTGNGTAGHAGAAILLPDGKVLIVGASKSELYDPSTGGFTPTGSLVTSGSYFTATLLTNGKVLFTGGINGHTAPCIFPIAADPELYDPATGQFSLAGPYDTTGFPTDACSGGTWGLTFTPAISLSSGKVLILSEPAAELYDPVTNTFKQSGSIDSEEEVDGRTATLMFNGKVLVAGGEPENNDYDFLPHSSAELYSPSAGTFSATGSMRISRYRHAATPLPDGTVLITGGITDNWYNAPPLAELYDPSTAAFIALINMNASRSSHQATLLQDGRVLITGGTFTGPYSVYGPWTHASAEFYNPAVLIPAPVLASLWHSVTGQLVSFQNPAVAGEVLSMYTTSLGAPTVIPPKVAIGGRLGEILFSGDAPGYPGYNQINVRVPPGVAPGPTVPVRLTYLGRASNEVTIGVQ